MKRILIGIGSAILFGFLIMKVPVLAIAPLFLMMWAIRSRIQLSITHFYSTYVVIGIIFGGITEILAILDNLHVPPEEKILFHPDPGIDLLLGVGFYFFIALIWAVLFKRYEFTWKSIMIIGGIWGITAEQNGMVLLRIITEGVLPGLLGYGFVFLVYGPFMAIPALFLDEGRERGALERKERSLKHLLLAWGGLWGAYILAGVYMVCVGMVLGLQL